MTTIPEIAPGLHATLSIVEITGATYRQVNYWVAQGYLRPTPVHVGSDPRSSGIGNRMIFEAHEVRVAWLMGHLVQQGMAPANAAPIARELADVGESTVGALTYRVEAS